MIGSVNAQQSAAHPALAARQSCQCQPNFVRPGRARLNRATYRTRAQEGEKQDIKEEIKQDLKEVKGFFTGSSNASRGYTEEDSAGQSNIFAVEPKQYVAGSQRDVGTDNNSPAIIAAGFGIGILVLGLLALRTEKPAATVARAQLVKEVTQYRSLSQLRDQLAVVSAPSLAVES
ncbi:g3616 [Coccomyxa viridis]|uniref:G3616 protein n=1 Tax=Coccomyxa viridis TaxID=1274662 RepID=A0ABP1FTD5_9CHLO